MNVACAQRFSRPRAALVAAAVGAGQPGDAGAIADLPAVDAGADRLDAPDDLVPGDDRTLAHREVTLAQLQVGAADAARGDAQEKLARAGRLGFALDGDAAGRWPRARLLQHHGAA